MINLPIIESADYVTLEKIDFEKLQKKLEKARHALAFISKDGCDSLGWAKDIAKDTLEYIGKI